MVFAHKFQQLSDVYIADESQKGGTSLRSVSLSVPFLSKPHEKEIFGVSTAGVERSNSRKVGSGSEPLWGVSGRNR